VILANKATIPRPVSVNLKNATAGSRFYYYVLTGGSDNGEFSQKVFVNGMGPAESSGGPAADYTSIKPYSTTTQNGINLNLPARSVLYVVIDKP
jgi:hypothetical protein